MFNNARRFGLNLLHKGNLISQRKCSSKFSSFHPRYNFFPFSLAFNERPSPFPNSRSFSTDKKKKNKVSRNDMDLAKGLDRIPLPKDVIEMPRKFRNCDNKMVFMLAVLGEHGARRERLIREIMRVDNVSWQDAHMKLEQINQFNDQWGWLTLFPYRIGVMIGLTSSLVSVPLVFQKECVLWFAENIVKYPADELPAPDELDTIWLVGKLSWEWMEPLIGTMTFFLLGLQFMRAQMHHIGLKPYADFVVLYRARRLVKRYPQYDRNILTDFAATDQWDK
eukprot:maker-scaffold_11-snap-gene-4.42-mRNA-1 protein AED:0.05 eAED:0.05 QI:75/1/1/1/0.75/0.6/5/43/278